MKRISKHDWELKLSLYLDNELSPEQREKVDEYLKTNPTAMKELEDLRRIRDLLSSSSRLETNKASWTQLSERLAEREREAANLLPFHRKYVPIAVALSAVVLTFIGYVAFTERSRLMQYLSSTSQDVQQAYEENILKGSVIPLFSKIDKNQVLQFALFGTLPLDANAQTSLRVDDESDTGYRLEVGRTETSAKSNITVADLLAEVEPTVSQTASIDSLLEDAKARIASSAFVAENNALAIDPEIGQLTRHLVSNIAANLDPARRARFDRYLRGSGAAYAIAASKAHAPSRNQLEPALKRMPIIAEAPEDREYLVITPDTMMVSRLFANFRDFEIAHERVREGRDLQEGILGLIRRFEETQQRRTAQRSIQQFHVVGGSGFVTIRVDRSEGVAENDSLSQWVTPRVRYIREPRMQARLPVPREDELLRREYFPGFPRDSMFDQFWRDMERFDIDVERMDSLFREMRGRRERGHRAIMDSMMVRWRQNEAQSRGQETMKRDSTKQ